MSIESIVVTAAVEGLLDESVVRWLVHSTGGNIGEIYHMAGKAKRRPQIVAYNHAARYSPWIVLTDLDHNSDCPVEYRSMLLPEIAPLMCCRVVVRVMLADPERIAIFLGVAEKKIPRDPESLDRAKRTVVDLARTSGKRDIRELLVPTEGSGREVGAGYTSKMTEFITDAANGWRPDVAASNARSLEKALICLKSLISKFQ
jgi:hypothetical protein